MGDALTTGMNQCQMCKSMRATSPVSFHRNVGMVLARRTYSVRGDLCKPRIHKMFLGLYGQEHSVGPAGNDLVDRNARFISYKTVAHMSGRSINCVTRSIKPRILPPSSRLAFSQ